MTPFRALFALLLVIGLVGLAVAQRPNADRLAHQGDINREGGFPDLALADYRAALEEQPDHLGAAMGEAVTLLTLDHQAEAYAKLTQIIHKLQQKPDYSDFELDALAVAFANRGILQDRRGKPKQALENYEQALALQRSVLKGPGAVDKITSGSSGSSISERTKQLKAEFSK